MMHDNEFKLALIQMLVQGGRKEANLQRALDRVNIAAAQGAQVVVLPEAMTLGCSLLVGPDGRLVLMGPYGHDADIEGCMQLRHALCRKRAGSRSLDFDEAGPRGTKQLDKNKVRIGPEDAD